MEYHRWQHHNCRPAFAVMTLSERGATLKTLAAHSVTSAMSTHALQICEPNMSTIAAASK